ncbi:MAG: nucleotidyltransferase domain-containing protein [Chitinispirillaceae bacterium]|nr:nucleotidyltransferase domain-containing protein [Chitinispirillaceae bacterium]
MSLFTKNQADILALFFAHPGEEYYLSQVGEALGKRPGVFQRGINALERDGIITSRKKGNQRLFSINREYVLLGEVKGIVNKTSGVEGALREFVNGIDKIEIALIFGSFAKNAMRADSDIDLLVVTGTPEIEDEIIGKLAGIERKLQREINCKIYAHKEYQRKRAGKDPFLQEIFNDKYILLKGKI